MRPTEVSIEGTGPVAVVHLDHPMSRDASTVGAKAAALAEARRAGLRVLDGFVISTAVVGPLLRCPPPTLEATLRHAWRRLSHDGTRAVVVRSSSPVEDGRTSSMAGQFRSVLDVRGWDRFLTAVGEVVASAGDAPMAVLVQPMLLPAWGGVLFGADPVTGRTDRLVVAAVPGGPDRLVSGEVAGFQLSLSPRGRLLDGADGAPPALRSWPARRRLLRLARQVSRVFGGPQDIEWAMDAQGRITLLQARPITAVGDDVRATGPLLGPGPVAETFPAPLTPLEEELWVPPLREGLRRSLVLMGAVPARRLRSSPVVAVVGRRVAADLELLGVAPPRRSLWARLDPRPPARRLRAAWRVGRLRAGLPGLAEDLLAEVDADLREVPSVDQLDVNARLRLLRRAGDLLVSLHGYEVLAGQLLDAEHATTGASVALRTLARARAEMPGASDDELVARYPVLLALVPPAVRAGTTLPPTPVRLPTAPEPEGTAGTREALRLRIRWVHELMARTASSLGDELWARGAVAQAADVREWRLDELAGAINGASVRPAAAERPGAPLPSAFRLTPDGVVVPVVTPPGDGRSGRGAGGGRGAGPVKLDRESDVRGTVLVVSTLDPDLAPLLPGLAGLVAETGSVLSHLAILAREYGVPTVVDLPGARERFTAGTWVVVDGSTGDVTAVDDEEWAAA